MFKFLKDKLKSAISKISEGVEKEGAKEEIEVQVEQSSTAHLSHAQVVQVEAKPRPKEEKSFFSKVKESIFGKEPAKTEDKPIQKIEPVQIQKKEPLKEEIHEEKTIHKAPEHKEKTKEAPEIKIEKKIEKKIEIRPVHTEKIKHKEEPKVEIKVHPKTEIKFEPKAEKTEPKIKTEAHEIKEETKRHEIKVEHKPIQKEEYHKPILKEAEQKFEESKEEKKGFFAALKEKIVTTKINEQQFESLFWDMELALMENNVAMEVIEKIKNDLKGQLVEKPIRRTKVEDTILETLKSSIEDLFESSSLNLFDEIKSKQPKPYIIAFLGINGSGKTTSIAKIASMLKNKGFSVVLAAADTFRAASIEQLNLHAEKVGVKMIKHDYGADPAAVAFDAIKHAQAKNIDVVLIDTAGRMHSNENLVAEMKKIIRVAKPDLKIFVGESITGNDCVEQAKTFNEAVGIDGIILAKADIDEKGGAAISVSYVTKKPILFLGTGQEYKDIEPFDKERIIKNIGLA